MNLDKIFRAYDIRSQSPGDLTPEIAQQIGRAIAKFLPGNRPVAIGRDVRADSVAIAQNLAQGIANSGREVWNLGLISTEMLYFAVGKFELAGGAMVTASHNPAGFNGIKICGPRAQVIGIDNGLAQIRDLAADHTQLPTTNKAALVTTRDISQEWIEYALSFVDVKKWPKFGVAFDTGNGVLGQLMPLIKPLLPLRVEELFWELDGSFPNRPPDPTVADNLAELAKVIKAQKLDFGVAFDSDGDRMVLMDDKGGLVSPNLVMILLAEAALKINPGTSVVIDVRTSRLVADVIAQNGGRALRSPVGGPHITNLMRQVGASLGGELAGHYYFNINWFAASGLIASLMLIEILAQKPQPLSQLAAEYPTYYQSGELNFTSPNKNSIIDLLSRRYQDGQQDDLDGLSVNYPQWWFNIRPSNTENLLRLNIEANTPAELTKRTRELSELIRSQPEV